MVKQHDILADLHVHTLFSNGGQSTLHEVLCGGRRSGMRYVAITDIAQISSPYCISKLAALHSETGVKIIPGIEYVDVSATMDSGTSAYTIMGVHPLGPVLSTICTANSYFEVWVKAMQSSNILAVAHLHKHLPSLLDEGELVNFYGFVISYLKNTGIWLEISPWTSPLEKRALSHILALLEKEKGVDIAIGSGAKYCEDVGRFHDVLELFNTFDINQKRVVNTNEEVLSMLYNSTHPAIQSNG